MPTAPSSTTTRSDHEIIVDTEHRYAVWPARKRLPDGWRYLGRAGTREELEVYLREMFVVTLPAAAVTAAATQGH